MTDRELLELAAKAEAVSIGAWRDEIGAFMYREAMTGRGYWNPLIDDGDALRLAVKLKMMIDFITVPNSWMAGCTVAVSNAGNFYEKGFTEQATRRAIVRAAAEIGAKP